MIMTLRFWAIQTQNTSRESLLHSFSLWTAAVKLLR